MFLHVITVYRMDQPIFYHGVCRALWLKHRDQIHLVCCQPSYARTQHIQLLQFAGQPGEIRKLYRNLHRCLTNRFELAFQLFSAYLLPKTRCSIKIVVSPQEVHIFMKCVRFTYFKNFFLIKDILLVSIEYCEPLSNIYKES